MNEKLSPVVGEFCIAMGTVDVVVDEVLFLAVIAYQERIKSLEITEQKAQQSRTLSEYPHTFPNKMRLVEQISLHLLPSPIPLRTFFPENVELIPAVDELYELRNAILHGQHEGVDESGKHKFRRYIKTRENKKNKFDDLTYAIHLHEIKIMSRFLRMLQVYLCACVSAIQANCAEATGTHIDGTIFWDTINNIIGTSTLEGGGNL